jgi:pyrroline-5-carboxylate reductase
VISDRGSGKGEILAKKFQATYIKNSNQAIEGADMVILAVKPGDLPSLSSLPFTEGQHLISLLVGTRISTLKKTFPHARITRLMPNTAIAVKQGVLAFYSEDISLEEKKLIESVFSSLGLTLWIKENQMEAFAALAGSSPAFIFVLLESMIDSGLHMGFSVEESKKIVLKVLEGCSALVKETNTSLGDLKWQITSPGGTTIAGLKALEESSFRSGIWNALEATYQKSLSMI